jgi:hypothetical protein
MQALAPPPGSNMSRQSAEATNHDQSAVLSRQVSPRKEVFSDLLDRAFKKHSPPRFSNKALVASPSDGERILHNTTLLL